MFKKKENSLAHRTKPPEWTVSGNLNWGIDHIHTFTQAPLCQSLSSWLKDGCSSSIPFILSCPSSAWRMWDCFPEILFYNFLLDLVGSCAHPWISLCGQEKTVARLAQPESWAHLERLTGQGSDPRGKSGYSLKKKWDWILDGKTHRSSTQLTPWLFNIHKHLPHVHFWRECGR